MPHFLNVVSNLPFLVVGLYLIVYGCALIVMVRWVPQGLVGWIGDRLRRRAVARAVP